MPSVALPPEIRAKLYLGFTIIGVILGATQVGYGAANVAQPSWLTVALAVYVFCGPALGLTAASNTTVPDAAAPDEAPVEDAVDSDTLSHTLSPAAFTLGEPDREPGDSDPVVIYDRSQRPTCNPEEEGC